MKLGEVIKGWRERQYIGQREAAKRIGISLATLSRIENGKPIDGATMVRILDWLLH